MPWWTTVILKLGWPAIPLCLGWRSSPWFGTFHTEALGKWGQVDLSVWNGTGCSDPCKAHQCTWRFRQELNNLTLDSNIGPSWWDLLVGTIQWTPHLSPPTHSGLLHYGWVHLWKHIMMSWPSPPVPRLKTLQWFPCSIYQSNGWSTRWSHWLEPTLTQGPNYLGKRISRWKRPSCYVKC